MARIARTPNATTDGTHWNHQREGPLPVANESATGQSPTLSSVPILVVDRVVLAHCTIQLRQSRIQDFRYISVVGLVPPAIIVVKPGFLHDSDLPLNSS